MDDPRPRSSVEVPLRFSKCPPFFMIFVLWPRFCGVPKGGETKEKKLAGRSRGTQRPGPAPQPQTGGRAVAYRPRGRKQNVTFQKALKLKMALS
jgi:hypothetical protein